jgi:TolB protein
LNPLKPTMIKKIRLTLLVFALIAGCNRPASTPAVDLFATLQASTPSNVTAQPTQLLATPGFSSSTLTPGPTSVSAQTSIPSPSAADQPQGHIVFTCQVFKVQSEDQICIMNADGSGFRRLTTEDNIRHFYPSLAIDGRSVLYSEFFAENNYEIYSLNIDTGDASRLTSSYGVDNAPEVSPNGALITFMHVTPTRNLMQIMVMERSGDNAGNVPQVNGWDPTWSPDGERILFASDRDGTVQLYTIRPDGSKLNRITNLPSIRGRSDWSPNGQYIVTYSGESWQREIFIMNADGSNVRQLTPSGGNSQGPSFSPDGKWVVFTAYFDHYGDDHGCEIYIIRIDGTDLRRLTNNNYCDYQPRWGP